MTEAELQAVYDCLLDSLSDEAAEAAFEEAMIMQASWTQADRDEGRAFAGWQNFASVPYISFTHGERFAANHANDIAAEAYGRYEDVGEVPAGGIIAKPTFSISQGGEAMLETLFLMEKGAAGSLPDSNDWIYTSILADGTVQGRTGGMNGAAMQSCADCHMAMGDGQDDLAFMPEEYRR